MVVPLVPNRNFAGVLVLLTTSVKSVLFESGKLCNTMDQTANTSTANTFASSTPKFQSIEFQKTPWTRWAGSLVINGSIVIAVIIIPLALNQGFKEQERKLSTVSLVDPPHLTVSKPPPAPKLKLIARVVPPPPVKTPPKQFKAPAPVVKPVEAKAVSLPPAPVEIPRPVQPKPVELARLDVPKFDAPKFELPAAPPAPAPVKVVKTGGFGDPNGVPANNATNHGPVIQKIGAFDMSSGSDHGSGSGAGGKGKLVASAGFGDGGGTGSGQASGPGGNGRGVVRGAGFGDGPGTGQASAPAANTHGVVRGAGFGEYAAPSGPAAAHAATPAAHAQTPVEITYKPKPSYTPEAREKKIEGEVQLEVLFSSAGQVQVIRLVRGLGYGLDENAREAASRIRFRPGTKNGAPVDTTGTVHIVFELS